MSTQKIKAELSTFMLPEVTDTHSSSFSPICMQAIQSSIGFTKLHSKAPRVAMVHLLAALRWGRKGFEAPEFEGAPGSWISLWQHFTGTPLQHVTAAIISGVEKHYEATHWICWVAWRHNPCTPMRISKRLKRRCFRALPMAKTAAFCCVDNRLGIGGTPPVNGNLVGDRGSTILYRWDHWEWSFSIAIVSPIQIRNGKSYQIIFCDLSTL